MSAPENTSGWCNCKVYLSPPFIVPVTILLAVILFHFIHGPIIPTPL